jgi:glycosyltransferase involved in cell wall biosynthesis
VSEETTRYSLVMAALNPPPPEIAAAINSALQQDIPPSEIVIIDDGSEKPLSLEGLFDNANIKVHRQRNSGYGSAINAGIRLASHPILSFLDHDDLWCAGKSRYQLEEISRGSDVVMGSTEIVDERLTPPSSRVVGDSRVFGACMFKKSVFDEVGLFIEDARTGEPLEWWSRFDEKSLRASSVPRTVLRRRIHGSNLGLRDPASSSADLIHRVRQHIERKLHNA